MVQCIQKSRAVVSTVVATKYFTANSEVNAVQHSYDSVMSGQDSGKFSPNPCFHGSLLLIAYLNIPVTLKTSP